MFLNNFALVLLMLIPIVVIFTLWRENRRRIRLNRIGDPHLVTELIQSFDPMRRWVKLLLWLIAITAVILAIARPVWGIDETFIQAQGVAVVVVLDVSASMNAEDLLPSRLERAKLAARSLFEGGQGNQLGLILFAGTALVQFPLTTDSAAAITFLNAASSNSVTRQGTAVGDALRLAIESFDARISSDRVIILMTDGENHEGDPVSVAEEAADQGILIYTIGYGSDEGEPIPEFDDDGNITGYKGDAAGNLVLSRLDEGVLQEIATSTGGIYQRATDSGIEIVNLLNEIAVLEQGVLESRRQIQRVERFALFLAIAVVALTFEIVLPEAKRDAT